MLALEGHGVVVVVNMAVHTLRAAFQIVAGIDLNSRLGGVDLNAAAALLRPEFRSFAQLAFHPAVQHEAVVVALGYAQRFEVGLDIPADGFGVHEVHGRACNRNGFAERNETLGGGQELGGVEAKHMVQHRAGSFAVQVEIGMVGKIHYRCLVGLRGEG